MISAMDCDAAMPCRSNDCAVMTARTVEPIVLVAVTRGVK
jgi:hypothetical protein